MELKDTVEMMQSADYKERFKAEYQQTKIRTEDKNPGHIEGYFVHIPGAPTGEDVAKAKKEVVENICRIIREIAEARDDFFIIKESLIGDGVTVGNKFILPTVML